MENEIAQLEENVILTRITSSKAFFYVSNSTLSENSNIKLILMLMAK